jgi:hypothetical protein
MYRITTVGSLPLGLSRRLLAQCFATLFTCLLVCCGLALFGGLSLQAQSTSGGGIQGTVTDSKGAVIAKAQITATNTDTGVAFTRESTSTGYYSIAPLPVGTYNVEVVAKGFQRLLQENIDVDNASMHGLNLTLTVGGGETTITITDQPPYMDTTDATLGGTIENQLYSSLPLSMNGGPRDPTAFQYLMPGVQENPANNTNAGSTAGSSGIYGGTGQNNLNQNYVEGVPVSDISAQGSGTAISNAVSVDAVNQFSVQTSGSSTSFGGAGSTNYTINSGGNQLHGTVFDFIRNTDFDTWGYFSKVANSAGYGEKPGEHQNSYGGSLSGPILKDKLFFFGSYEGFRYTKISNTPAYITIPTMDNRAGNFTDSLGSVNAQLADPTYTLSGTRPAFQGMLNGVPTFNVVPAAQFSPITTALQAELPLPTNLSTFQNYLAILPLSNNDYTVDVKIDYTLNSKNKFSILGLGGLLGYGGAPNYANYSQLPIPYAAGTYGNQKTATGVVSYVYIASQSLINTFKYGFTRNWGEGFALTKGTPYTSTTAGITNLPVGNGANNFPDVQFNADSGPTAPCNWNTSSCGSGSGASNSTGPNGRNTYTALDNLTWIKNRHNVTFGAQVQWEETNIGGYGGYSSTISLVTHGEDTAGPGNGSTYASFLLGAIETDNVSTQTIQDVGGRYRPMALYIQDNWQVSPKLTLNLGIRYDYLQPYHEVHNRISFLDNAIINPIAGIPGVLEFAGTANINDFTASLTNPSETAQVEYNQYAPYMCNCRTPVHPYNDNFQPRLGFAYAYNSSTTINGAFGISVTHSGGVGGGSGATSATGNNGEFSTSSGSSTNEPARPSFFLNPNFAASAQPSSVYVPPQQGTEGIIIPPATYGPNIPCVTAGTCSNFSALPPWTQPGTNVNPLNTTGNYDYTSYFGVPPAGPGTAVTGAPENSLNNYNCSASGTFCNPQGVNFADPYYGGRGPQFVTYNLSIQRMINKKAVFTIAYAGTQTHFLRGGSGRGYAQNTISPDWAGKLGGSLPNNGFYGSTPPYPRYGGSSATVFQSLRPFPQFSGFTDIWPDTGNANDNELQLSVIQRPWHNLSGLINYTRRKEIDDTGNHRTQFPVGPQDGNFVQNMSANRVDRGLGTANQTDAFNLSWSYTFPFGRGQAFFATNRIAGLIGEGWEFSGIYRYRDGSPIQVTISGSDCMTSAVAGQGGTCLPDYVPGFDKRQARINGRWGRGPGSNSSNFNNIAYLNPNAFQCPDSGTYGGLSYTCGTTAEPNTTFKLGNIARSAPLGLTGPGWWDIDLGLRRTFNIRETATMHLTFQFEADVTNATNSTFFVLGNSSLSVNGSNWSNPNAYGTVSQQNTFVVPRDWQFEGRFRF